MNTHEKYALADMLKAALDGGGARRDVKFALAALSSKDRAMLLKLLNRSIKKHDAAPKCETCGGLGYIDSEDGPCATCSQEIPITCPDCKGTPS